MFETIYSMIDRVFIREERWRHWVEGFQRTLSITFFALLLGLTIGLIIAVTRVSHDTIGRPGMLLRFFNLLARIYVSVVRGIPLVVQLMIMNFVVLAASRNGVLIASLAFGINSGAYVSEAFRGGILSIDKGQMEAGRSLGLSYVQTMFRIILPQAIKNCLPMMGNEFIALLKYTSIAGYVAIRDLTHVANTIRGRTFDPSPLFFIAAIYLILVLILENVFGRMERRLRRSDRR
jgi:His/Glu/Gln/Arg/opine family amino acid ABC transporter permease subunit